MSDELIKQAELRHQRRPRSTIQNEEIMPLDKTCSKLPQTLAPMSVDSKQSLPPIRFPGNHENATPLYNLSSPNTKSDDRPRTPRRRNISHNAQDILAGPIGNGQAKGMRLPVVTCKMNEKEYKALVNTASPHSTLHRRIWEANSSKSGPPSQITIGCSSYKASFSMDDVSIHDIVLGMDFISSHKCVLNFNANTFSVNSDTTVAFAREEDLPIKYRTSCRTNLTASM